MHSRGFHRAMRYGIAFALLALLIYLALWLYLPERPVAAPTADGVPTTATLGPTPPELPDIIQGDVIESASPSASPSASLSPTPSPSKDNKNACPYKRTLDKTDPACKKLQNEAIYRKHYANSPAFNCPDNRNDGIGPQTFSQAVPCINSSLRLEISSTGDKMSLYASTTPSNKVSLRRTAPEVANPRALGLDWIVWQEFKGGSYKLCLRHDADLAFFGMYVRTGTTGDWQRKPSCTSLTRNTAPQVVVFWDDPAKPDGDAPLPPFFNWRSVAKH